MSTSGHSSLANLDFSSIQVPPRGSQLTPNTVSYFNLKSENKFLLHQQQPEYYSVDPSDDEVQEIKPYYYYYYNQKIPSSNSIHSQNSCLTSHRKIRRPRKLLRGEQRLSKSIENEEKERDEKLAADIKKITSRIQERIQKKNLDPTKKINLINLTIEVNNLLEMLNSNKIPLDEVEVTQQLVGNDPNHDPVNHIKENILKILTHSPTPRSRHHQMESSEDSQDYIETGRRALSPCPDSPAAKSKIMAPTNETRQMGFLVKLRDTLVDLLPQDNQTSPRPQKRKRRSTDLEEQVRKRSRLNESKEKDETRSKIVKNKRKDFFSSQNHQPAVHMNLNLHKVKIEQDFNHAHVKQELMDD